MIDAQKTHYNITMILFIWNNAPILFVIAMLSWLMYFIRLKYKELQQTQLQLKKWEDRLAHLYRENNKLWQEGCELRNDLRELKDK